MKKALFLLIIQFIILFININLLNAVPIKQGEYLEQNQWGALEDLIKDFNNGIISTNECAIYGCYVLIASEPERTDKDKYIKLIPKKYNLHKKSENQAPYFFIKFIYDNKHVLSATTLKEFNNSEWSVFEIFDNFITNPQIKKIIDTTPKTHGYFWGSRFIPFDQVARQIINKQIMSTEEIFIIARIFNHNSDYPEIFNIYNKFFRDNYLTPSTMKEEEYFMIMYIDISKTSDRKIIKLINFLLYVCENKFLGIDHLF